MHYRVTMFDGDERELYTIDLSPEFSHLRATLRGRAAERLASFLSQRQRVAKIQLIGSTK